MSERRIITAEGAPTAIGPYSHAVAGGGLVFLSGQVGADPVTGDLADGVAAQAEQALRNIAVVLGAAGTDLSRVVKATIFLTDMGDFATVQRGLRSPRRRGEAGALDGHGGCAAEGRAGRDRDDRPRRHR